MRWVCKNVLYPNFRLIQRENAVLSEHVGLEQADAAFKRAIALVVVRPNGIESNRELERSQRQRTSNGPSLS